MLPYQGALLLCALLLNTHTQSAFAGPIEGVNHTKWAINRFSVDGQSAIDVIGPFQGGGGGGSYRAPSQWKPGMTVRVDWETGLGTEADSPFPRPKRPIISGHGPKVSQQVLDAYNEKQREWFLKIKTLNKQHSRIVPLPPYTSGEGTCGIVVHFFPCDQIKVTTSCYDYGNPKYPIKEPIHIKEPAVCPK